MDADLWIRCLEDEIVVIGMTCCDPQPTNVQLLSHVVAYLSRRMLINRRWVASVIRNYKVIPSLFLFAVLSYYNCTGLGVLPHSPKVGLLLRGLVEVVYMLAWRCTQKCSTPLPSHQDETADLRCYQCYKASVHPWISCYYVTESYAYPCSSY